MVAPTYYWRLSHWIWMACPIGLAGCVIGLAVHQYWPARGSSFLAATNIPRDAGTWLAGKLAVGQPADDDLEKAVEAFDMAIEKNPGNAFAYCNRANARQLQGKTDAAIHDYGKALSLDPEHADSYCGRAAAYLEQGRFELAIDDLTKAIVPSPIRAKPTACVLGPICLREITLTPWRMLNRPFVWTRKAALRPAPPVSSPQPAKPASR